VSHLQFIFFALVLASLAGCAGSGRQGRWGGDAFPGVPFYLGAYNLPHELGPDGRSSSNLDGKSQLHVLVDVIYANLQFVLDDSGYQARFETSIAVMNEAGTVAVRDVSKQIFVDNFAATASKEGFERVGVVLEVAPGDYQLVASVTDKNSLGSRVRHANVRVKNFQTRPGSARWVAVSDIMFFDRLPEAEVLPAQSMPGYRGNYPEEFYAVAQLISNDPQSLVEVTYQLNAPSGEVLLENQLLHSVARDGKWLEIRLRQEDLRVGENQLEIRVRSGNATDLARRRFVVRWSGLPTSATSLDEAIEQLRYVASRSEMPDMRKTTEAEKKVWFQDFWQQRDPTPGTPENELQEEYYARVAEANKRFYVEGGGKGWRTDRGRILILYGFPDNVSREASYRNFTVTYEIWYYESIGRRFIFREEGSGRYILVAVQ
jgi:GWxTD domain-containing protein